MDDVTRQRLMEEEVRQAAKMESVGKLAGGVAHDFNNMLTVIKGYAELALSDAASDGLVRDYAAEIVNTASRAADLTRQLLAFGLRQTLSPRPLNLNDVVLGMEEMLGRMIGEDIELLANLADDLGTVEADPVQIEQVIMNLAANVRDAMPQGGKLILETFNAVLDQDYASMHVGVAPGRYVMLAVTDTGCGMDQETLEHIFEPFFTTKEVGAGSGLGLSTVYGIVKQHGGYIWAYSEVGRGTTFRVYLPRVDVETEAKTPAEPQLEQTARGAETILVVEDEAAVRSLVHLVLKRAGYGVLSASSPDEAEVLFAQRADEVALLLTDVVMPGRSGRELYEQLAARGAYLKVLYMSGYSEDAIVHRGVLRQDVEFISKPFTSDQLLKRIRGMLDK
jgi:nitrogen-specific signal transduction histidine kinase